MAAVLCGGGAWWWTSRPDFGHVVRQAGGRYRFDDMSTPPARLINWFNDRPSPVYHWIEFAPGEVDDAWLRRHQTQMREQSILHLALHETRVTDRGLSHLHGAENVNGLSLRGTRLTDAAMTQIVGLPHLNTLDIAETGLSGTAVADLAHLLFLGQVTIDSSQATAEAMAGLQKCPRLNNVMIVDANDESVAQIAQLTGLVGLVLIGEGVTAASLPALKQMRGLQVLSFVDGSLSADEIHDLQQSLPGCTVQQVDSQVIEQIEDSMWE